MTGKVYIVTGANTGIGYETTTALVKMGATVVMACRSRSKANSAKESIEAVVKCAASKLLVIDLDLCNYKSVRSFVKQFNETGRDFSEK